MSEIITLGPVGLNPLGEYNSETEYEKLDVVLYQGSSYVALQTVQGIVPTNTEYWQKLVSGGVGVDDIVDNLDSSSIDKPLSARQGKILNDEKRQKYNWKLSQPYLNTENGTFVLIQADGKVILEDCGNPGQDTLLRNFLASKQVTHIDVLMISHFHGDHAGCQETILREYCDEDTQIYIGVIPDYDQFTGNEAGSKTLYNSFVSICSELGYEYSVPINNSVQEITDNVSIRFLNTDSSYLTDYYSSYSDTDLSRYQESSLNNCSMVSEITIYDDKILLTGDVEQIAQSKIKDYIQKVDVLQVPHHNWNRYGDKEFFDNANPTISFANRGTTAAEFFPYYSRYIKFTKPVRIIQNLEVPIEFECKNGNIDVLSGVHFETAYDDPSKIKINGLLPAIDKCLFSEVDLFDLSLWDSAYVFNLWDSKREIINLIFQTAPNNSLALVNEFITKFGLENRRFTLNIYFRHMDLIDAVEPYMTYRIYRYPTNENAKYTMIKENRILNKELTGTDIKGDNIGKKDKITVWVTDDDASTSYKIFLSQKTFDSNEYEGHIVLFSLDTYLSFIYIDVTFTSVGYTINKYFRIVQNIQTKSITPYTTNPSITKVRI